MRDIRATAVTVSATLCAWIALAVTVRERTRAGREAAPGPADHATAAVWRAELAEPHAMGLVKLDGETREAFTAQTGRSFDTDLVVAPRASLELGFALQPDPESLPARSGCAGSWRFSARVLPGGWPLLEERLDSNQAGRWHTRRVPLAAGAAPRLRLRLQVQREPGACAEDTTAGEVRPLWGRPLAWLAGEPERQPARGPAREVLLVSLDGCEAQALATAWPGPAVRFDQAQAVAGWSVPAHMSLLSGRYPAAHGLHQGRAQLAAYRDGQRAYRKLPPGLPTLPERLRQAGYLSAAWVADPDLIGELGFARGFDRYHEGRDPATAAGSAEIERLRAQARGLPLFLYLQTRPAPAACAARSAELLARLAGGARPGPGADTLFFVVGTTGQRAGLSAEALRVPFLIAAPHLSERRSSLPVDTLDVAPTLLASLGLPGLPGSEGRNLLLSLKDPAGAARTLHAEATPAGIEVKGLHAGSWHYLAGFETRGEEHGAHPGPRLWERLYDLERDPHEVHDRHAREPERLAALRLRLAERLRRDDGAGEGALE